MPFVRNLVTGFTHEVNPGHWSLTSSEYEVVPDPMPAPPPPAKPPPKPRPAPSPVGR